MRKLFFVIALMTPIVARGQSICVSYPAPQLSEPRATLAAIPIAKAFSDSVDVFFDAEMEARLRPFNRDCYSPNYKLQVITVPIIARGEDVKVRIYSIVLSRRPAITGDYPFLANRVGYTTDPALVASEMATFVIQTLRR